jgi:signal transduction histidine kinase
LLQQAECKLRILSPLMEPLKKRSFSRKTFPLLLVGISGLIITIVVFFTVREKEFQEVRSDFHFTTNNLNTDIKDIIENDIDTLQLVDALFQGSEFVTQGEFQKFVHPILERHPNILVFGWIPFVKPAEREIFYQKIAAQGYRVPEKQNEKNLFSVNGEKRQGFYPVFYLEGAEKDKLGVGTEVANTPEIYKALCDSADNQTMGAVEVPWPFGTKSDQKVYMVFLPVFGKNFLIEKHPKGIKKSLGGFIFGFYPVSTVIKKTQEKYELSGIQVDIVKNSTAIQAQAINWQKKHQNEILQNSETLTIGNRQLVIQSRSLPGFIPLRLSWRPGVSLAAGIFMTCLLLIYLDHTYRRTAHIELLAEKLSGEVAERQRVAEAREMLVAELEAKNAELERFTYTVSHDLKSPLITIRGFTGLLAKDSEKGDSERVQADVNQIKSATDKMQRLLDELLELSRVGRLVNPAREIALNDLIQEALDILTGRISEGGVEVSIAPRLPVVFGDHPRLIEVFQNLIDNAVKFMGEQPSPRIDIFAEQWEEKVACFVRDNGSGIAKDYQTKVFGLFERLDQNTEGTGIGLALVKRIVEFHGGRIWVESDGIGKGSTFIFTLPVKQEGNSNA